MGHEERTSPTVDDLHAAIEEVADFLAEHEREDRWLLDQVRRCADEVGRGDGHGARRYRDLNGPLAGLRFSPVNGNAADDAEAQLLNRRIEALHERAYALAGALLRAGR